MDPMDTERELSHVHGCGARTKNLLQILGCILTLAGVITALFLMYVAFDRPDPLKMDVTDASLTQFHITTAANDTLHFHNLALNINLQNPNDYFRIYYHNTLVVADYRNHRRFTMAIRVADFRQPEKNTTYLKLQLNNYNITDIADAEPPNYYNIVVEVRLRNTYKSKLRPAIHWHWNTLFTCDLTVPLKINGSQSANMTTSAFQTTKGKSDYEHRYWYN